MEQFDDPFGRELRADGENVRVHALAHTVMNVALAELDRERIRDRFDSTEVKQLWRSDFALENGDEFIAEISQAYFCANPEESSFLHT